MHYLIEIDWRLILELTGSQFLGILKSSQIILKGYFFASRFLYLFQFKLGVVQIKMGIVQYKMKWAIPILNWTTPILNWKRYIVLYKAISCSSYVRLSQSLAISFFLFLNSLVHCFWLLCVWDLVKVKIQSIMESFSQSAQFVQSILSCFLFAFF